MTAQTRSASVLRDPRWSLVGLSAGFLYAILGFLAFEPLAWWPLAVAAPMPLMALALVLSTRTRRARWRASVGAWVGSLPLWVLTHAWIFQVSPVGFFPGMLLQGAWAGLFVLLASLALRGRRGPVSVAFTLALVWSFVEVFRGSVLFGGYPWLLIGHPIIDAPLVALAGAVVGAYGLGFAVAISSAGVAVLARSGAPWHRGFLVFLLPWPGLWALGLLAPSVGEAAGVRVALIQTNVPQDNRMRWSIEDQVRLFEDFANLTLSARGRADLVVWPETMLPGPPISTQALAVMRAYGLAYATNIEGLEHLPATAFADGALALHEDLGVPMLVGAVGVQNLRLDIDTTGGVVEQRDALFNSVHMFAQGRLSDTRYDKLRLTIFGEVLPLVSRWDWLERMLLFVGAGGMAFDLDAGEAPQWFDVPMSRGRTLRVGTPICFEVASAGVCRTLSRGGGQRVDALVNVTNDGWFATSDAGRAMHLRLARWRALENGVPIVRAANTGISAFIDARGRIHPAEYEPSTSANGNAYRTGGVVFAPRSAQVVLGEVPGVTRTPTPWSRAGYLIPWALGLIGLIVVTLGILAGRGRA